MFETQVSVFFFSSSFSSCFFFCLFILFVYFLQNTRNIARPTEHLMNMCSLFRFYGIKKGTGTTLQSLQQCTWYTIFNWRTLFTYLFSNIALTPKSFVRLLQLNTIRFTLMNSSLGCTVPSGTDKTLGTQEWIENEWERE